MFKKIIKCFAFLLYGYKIHTTFRMKHEFQYNNVFFVDSCIFHIADLFLCEKVKIFFKDCGKK